MLKNISLLWGNTNIDIIDPLVKILIESLAGELSKVNNTIETIEERLLPNLASLMTPSFFSMPSCSHGILTATPNDCEDLLLMDSQFEYHNHKTDIVKKNIFSSFQPMRLFDVSIEYIVTENSIQRNTRKNLFETIINHTKPGALRKEIWVGIRHNANIKKIDNIAVFFNSKSENLLHVIHHASWYLNNTKLDIKNGLQFEKESLNSTLINSIEKEIVTYYDKYFITILTDIIAVNTGADSDFYPKYFFDFFSIIELNVFTEPLIWLKLEFPVPVDATILTDLTFHVNAFPVINRVLKEQVHRIKGLFNTIPILTKENELLFSIKSVEDNAGNVYTQYPSVQDRNHHTYSVNTATSKRFDAEAAKKQIQHLIETIRDESAAFSAMGQDNLINIITEIDRLLAQLHQRVNKSDKNNGREWNTICLHEQHAADAFFITYWVSNGIQANGIAAGTKLHAYKGSQFKKDSIQLLTTSIGAQPAADKATQLDAYKYALLTNNRIITAEDIKACCVQEMKHKITQEILVQRGLVPGIGSKQGLVRCLEVTLKKEPGFVQANPQHDWTAEKQLLQSKIEQRSALHLMIRVDIV